MNRTLPLLIVTALALLATGCASTVTSLPPAVAPTGEDRFLVDPRTGVTATIPPAVDRQFETAWRHFLAGNLSESRLRLDELTKRQPNYVPAQLAYAAIHIHEKNFDAARATVSRVLRLEPTNLVARVYEAEIAFREGQMRRAQMLYRDVAALPNAPATASERLLTADAAIYAELVQAAQAAPPTESVPLLREALILDPAAFEPRMLLVQRLVESGQFDEARRELDPLLATNADREEVQVALAEIDAGRGRHEEAIARFDRLARRSNNPAYARRLEEIKQQWSDANMPTQYREAAESGAITRAQLAVLLYWTVPSVRFAQNLSTPPIAIDIADVVGRDEMIRAIALGLYEVDNVTRRVGPYRNVTGPGLNRLIARLLVSRRAACARPYASERDESTRTAAVLSGCRIPDAVMMAGDQALTGREVQRVLTEVAKAF